MAQRARDSSKRFSDEEFDANILRTIGTWVDPDDREDEGDRERHHAHEE